MIPGFRGVKGEDLKRLMKQHGIGIEELKDVEKVIIQSSEKEYVFYKPQVSLMTVGGVKTYQVIGEPIVSETKLEFPVEDIELVAQTANASFEDAKKALMECNGNPADAIMKLKSI